MPKRIKARPARDEQEAAKVRKPASSRLAPQAVIQRARMVMLSWEGQRTATIAQQLGCHPQTVRERVHRFNDAGVDGLVDRLRSGRQRRIREAERSAIIALVSLPPPADSTVLCVDELGPVTPRTFRPAPGWSPDGHRIKAPLDDGRGSDKA